MTALKQAGGIRLCAKILEDAEDAELRLILADGSDETCDNPAPEQYLEIGHGAEVDGQPVKGYVDDKDGTRQALLLGPVSVEGGELDIWIPCRSVGRGDIRVEFVRRTPRREGT